MIKILEEKILIEQFSGLLDISYHAQHAMFVYSVSYTKAPLLMLFVIAIWPIFFIIGLLLKDLQT